MLKVFIKIWTIKELRTKLFITLFFLFIYRFGSYIPIPCMNIKGINDFLNNVNSSPKGIMHILSSFTGGAFNRASIFALGIMPYISASILIQLLRLILPYFHKILKDGESGRKKINYITRWLTLLISMIQAPSYIIALKNQFIPYLSIPQAYVVDLNSFNGNFIFWFTSILVLVTGTLFTLWLGEKINQKGIGNGISLIIMTGIISKLPESFLNEFFSKINFGLKGYFLFFIELLIWFFFVMFCVFIIKAVRKVPVQYVRSSLTNIESTSNIVKQYIPFKVVSAGVMPIIFSQAIMLLPVTLFNYSKNLNIKYFLNIIKDVYGFWHNIILILLIILFTFFYTAVSIPVNQISDDLKRSGGYVPRIKPGRDTSKYLDYILYKITFPGSILLSIIAILPSLVVRLGVDQNFSLFFGGTSLIILVSVFLDIIQQIDIYLLNNHYDGLMKNKNLLKI